MMFAVSLLGAVLVSFVVLSAARSEQFNPYARVTLVAYLCNGVTCIHETVPSKMMVAGKVDDYLEGRGIPMPYNYVLCKAQGFNDASQWQKQSPKYHTWLLHGVLCVPGHYEDPNKAQFFRRLSPLHDGLLPTSRAWLAASNKNAPTLGVSGQGWSDISREERLSNSDICPSNVF